MENNLLIDAGDLAISQNIPDELNHFSQVKSQNQMLKILIITIILVGVTYVGYKIVKSINDDDD
jgi:hypothetical protein